ncbi:glycosyltransferase family 4 protein [Flavobacterium sp. 3HN19-14]|uniref:glycosyltransferase family 4 protein n=1 Tax=Flavobacterium sp. 3HN19-14 TaxID=3448133 RepID=UPI003EE3FFC4
MKLLFLTMVKIDSVAERNLYTDLLRKFRDEGNEVFVVRPSERREKKKTAVNKVDGVTILNVKTFNLQKTNVIEKGIGTLAIEYQYLSAIRQYFSDVKFDLVLYSTPPITFSKVISYIKKRDGAFSYLLLKDIFPQNAVDMKMIKKGSAIHKLFLKKERKLYEVSDAIGCMSEANKQFLLQHNPEINSEKIEINPNTIEPIVFEESAQGKAEMHAKFNIPETSKVFIYGGNLGIPQGLDFLLETITAAKNIPDVFFIIIGTGTEFNRIQSWFNQNNPKNAMLLAGLPKNEYDQLLMACDVGLIFLSKDFTIPNFPSRLLSYLNCKMPVIAATDPNTDIGNIIEDAGCGFRIISGDTNAMLTAIQKLMSDEDTFNRMRENALKLLQNNYTVEKSYGLIQKKVTHV